MNSSLRDQLKDWKKKNQVPNPKKKKPTQKTQEPTSEHLSESDIKSLMGMEIPRFRRHRGALKQI